MFNPDQVWVARMLILFSVSLFLIVYALKFGVALYLWW